MPYACTDSEDIIYIADLGENPSLFINGKEESIHRYAVWNETKTRIVEFSSDLGYLRDKYGEKKLRILSYKPFMEKR